MQIIAEQVIQKTLTQYIFSTHDIDKAIEKYTLEISRSILIPMLKVTEGTKFGHIFSLDSIRRMIQKIVKVSFDTEDQIPMIWTSILRETILEGVSYLDIEEFRSTYSELLNPASNMHSRNPSM